MSRKPLLWSVCCLALVSFVAGPAIGQEASNTGNSETPSGPAGDEESQDTPGPGDTDAVDFKTAAGLASHIENNRQFMLDLTNSYTSLHQAMEDLKKLVDENRSSLNENRTSINELSGAITQNTASLAEVKQQIAELSGELSEQLERQRQILEAISTTDSNNTPVLRLNAIMDSSPDFKRDLDEAVHKVLRPVGSFTIVNRTNEYRTIRVNHEDHGIPSGEQVTLKVPVGNVATQLPGKPLKNWSVTAPKYDQKIEIVPDQQPMTTVQRPVFVDQSVMPQSQVFQQPVLQHSVMRPIYTPPSYYLPSYTSTYYWQY